MCGRFAIPIGDAWAMTPGEFEDYLSGCVDREREARIGHALTTSWIAKTMGGVNVPVLAFVDGEDAGGYGQNPFESEDDVAAKYARKVEKDNARRQRRWEAWLRRAGLDPSRVG